ncbi:riboflavin synthase subunit alpha [candidate division WOR-1 bacterium RIFCSPHIGHO2_01_FULL_53_15]|uniref:Riboflavin synthase n=1 Tax=candidate division WOR-1 bacterium RIFCSPHIGHO2_01_FULL_53_15 TaxID=1802564 RepID=A0A1F4PZS8_UNCSA|nr:MAG: riboflavin synthase subunit alpha [candidate division WOR-1 bacterium RIFCSPHIGHO2_01_FULL_53_15]OGC10657.1 MAG: riboflavin synthase subunit alpha [candidate division WOR-1 bacterium RIFCSPHIGHO2_02_FULL_53_26]
MFTGLIEQVGVVASLIRGQQAAKLMVAAPKIFDDLKFGDSIAVNGACLTVTHERRGFAEFDLSAETLKKTTLGDLRISDKVNLERALPVAGRLGGHLVTGHIDGVGEIRAKIARVEGVDLQLSVPSELLRYIVIKGPIAVEGLSLTVADIRDGLVTIAVIPQTVKATNLGERSVGDRVNLEVDLLSKYIEKHLRGEPKGITDETMMRVGFLPMGWIDN